MTIHFSPYYDAGVWSGEPARGECRKDEAFLGPSGLLDQLELRLGLTSRPVPSYMLFMQWLAAVTVAQEKEIGFYSKSLQTDRLGTAARLLEWRDALVLCGWTCDCKMPENLSPGAIKILNGLAAAEAAFRASGGKTVSDRWRTVLAAIPTSGIEQETIAIDVPLDMLEPLWRKLLAMLKDAGWKVLSPESMPVLPKEIEVLHFKDYVDACAWVAHQDTSLLAIARDGFTLNLALEAVGRASVSADTSESCHVVGHLFQDALRLLEPSVNRNTLVSYLSVTPHPLDQYENKDDGKKDLRFRLLNHIVRMGGFGEDTHCHTFESIIDDYLIPEDDRVVWLPAENRQEGVNVDDAIRLCAKLGEWANPPQNWRKFPESRNVQQRQQIMDACAALSALINGLGYKGVIPIVDFRRLLSYASQSSSFAWTAAGVDSMPVASTPSVIAADCEDAVWLDCASDEPADLFSFLSPVDIKKLRDSSLDIPLREETLCQADACCRAGLARVSRLKIAFCDKVATEVPNLHPVLIDVISGRAEEGKVRKWLKGAAYSGAIERKLTNVPFVPVGNTESEMNVGGNFLSDPEHLSPSSIDTLLEQTFDFVLENCLNLYDENEDNISRDKGSVAHQVIHDLILMAMGNKDYCTADDLQKSFEGFFGQCFDKAVRDKGLVLLLPENVLTLKGFQRILQDHSLPNFINILRDNNLRVIGSELPCKGKISCPGTVLSFNISAIIDVLLQDDNGNYLIFDFKWHGKSGERERKESIRKSKDYQLVIYRALVEQGCASGIAKGTVVDMSYYMLRSAVLFTASDALHHSEKYVEVVNRERSFDETLYYLFDQVDKALTDLRQGMIRKNKNKQFDRNYVLEGNIK